MTKLSKQQLKQHIDNINEVINIVNNWNPQQPDWKSYMKVSDHDIKTLAELYSSAVQPKDQPFVTNVLASRKMSSKQKFRLMCVLQTAVKHTSKPKPKKVETDSTKLREFLRQF